MTILIDLRELSWKCGKYAPGKNNAITDVPGVSVGHTTIIEGEGRLIPGKGPIRTGITVVIPHEGNIFREKVPAGVFVANGFGKSTGIPQINETGFIETPIAITNTLNVGLVFDALVSHAISKNPEIGITTSTVCPIVTECNDGYMNDLQGRHVKELHVIEAIKNAKLNSKIEQGCVGAGTGMSVFGLKSGVGTASRQLIINQGNYKGTYHVGILAVPNYGEFEDFQFYGNNMVNILDKDKYFRRIRKKKNDKPDGGSIIVLIATDLPLNNRQLNRIARRGTLGIAQTGSIMTHTSGDFIFAFSTKNRIEHFSGETIKSEICFNDMNLLLSDIFRMTVDAVQEAIYNAMLFSKTMIGRDDNIRVALDPNDLPEPS